MTGQTIIISGMSSISIEKCLNNFISEFRTNLKDELN